MTVMKQPIRRLQPVRNLLLAIVLVFLTPPYAGAFCFDEAGERYGMSPDLLRAIAKTESGFNPTAVNFNKNGSFDYGVMQINSSWYRELGQERWMGLGDACYNVHVGAWILSRCIGRYGYTWAAVGCYNGVSAEKRAGYAHKIYRALKAGKGANNGDK
ncbi:MAG: Transglycosylase SLT domain protein [Syntrophorhabdus sp. PtaB.Bin184]|nr:MAG: Transglycosylase SLT domain protein [Syntrophorhabdus sp. PtaB.Bin184]